MADRNDLPDALTELTDGQKTRWQAAVSDIRAMSAGLRDGTAAQEEIQGVLNRLLSCDVERAVLLDAVRVPDDAGAYAPGLEKILRRIPDGLGRWTSHGAGWYPLVLVLNERLAAIDADYVVHQVKEKFGSLRYYCDPSDEPSAEVCEAFDAITAEAEHASANICERCGKPGSLRQSNYLVITLCEPCAELLGYTPISPPEPR